MEYLVHIGYPKAASSFLQSSIVSGALNDLKPFNRNGEPYTGYQKSGGVLFFNKIDDEVKKICKARFEIFGVFA